MRGIILGSRMLASPASLPAADMLPLGIEAEIAFLFDRGLKPRAPEDSAEEVAAATTAVVGIEIVASRFRDYNGTKLLDRAADCMSNGAFIVGMHRPDWRSYDLSGPEATLKVNGHIVVQKTGGMSRATRSCRPSRSSTRSGTRAACRRASSSPPAPSAGSISRLPAMTSPWSLPVSARPR